MKKENVLARMKEDCLVAVVRAKNLEALRRKNYGKDCDHG